MSGVSCASCWKDISPPADGRLPPWCPHCGTDLKAAAAARPAGPAAPADVFHERAPSTAMPSRWQRAPAPGPEEAPPPAEPSRESAPGPVPVPMPLPPPRRSGPNLGLLFMGGLLATGCAVLSSWSIDKVTKHWAVAGKVVDLAPGRKGGTHPVVSYTFEGRPYRVKGGSSSGLFVPSYRIGDAVEVLVPPDRPGDATINRFADLWLGPLITGSLAAALLFFFWLDERQRRKPLPADPMMVA